MFQLDRVTAGYGAATVLRDVSLAVPSGAVAAVIGPNGAGKTTLMRVASGLLRPSGGAIRLDGGDLTGRRPFEFAATGVCHVPEGRGIFRSLTVRENLMMFSRRGKEADSLALAIEAFPRLGQRLGQLAGTMSGGEQQMVALARAYMGAPRVILLDEVSMGLAPKLVDEIFAFFERLKAEDVSLVIVEQYVSRVLATADYAYILVRGTLEFSGDPDELEGEDVVNRYLGVGLS